MGHESTVIFLLLTWMCIGVACFPSNNAHILERLRSNKPIQFCGGVLASAISLLCDGNYNTMEGAQASMDIAMSDSAYRYPYTSRQDAYSFGRFKQRKRRGVADECCTKPCTLNELKTFCGPQNGPSPVLD